jgi:two-component system, NtrC family, nitrogen regulation sensor histidine kinase GlnL
MSASALAAGPRLVIGPPDPAALFAALPVPVVLLDAANRFRFANAAAETFLGLSLAQLRRRRLEALLPETSPVFALLEQVRATGAVAIEHAVTLEGPLLSRRACTLHAAPLPEEAGAIVLTAQDETAARTLDLQLNARSAARSAAGMAALLAHEVRNPLSGIRGAAELLEASAGEADRPLAALIREEADRIRALVDRMALFEQRPPPRRAVNIHRVLDHVRRLAEAGFAQGLRLVESYDPSLPPVPGDHDQLVQIVLNLVKNAAEAIRAGGGGEIVLETRYRQGVHVSAPRPGSGAGRMRRALPLELCVRDDGPGIPEELRPHLFEAFVTGKPGGSGLGLALVAKLVAEHGGLVEVASVPGCTEFRLHLPVLAGEVAPA